MSRTKVDLIPWDPDSPKHATRMVEQRIACGWHEDRIPSWQEYQRSGEKCIYWIERESLADTAKSINATPRTPTGAFFDPVGHISLDGKNPQAAHLKLPIPSEHVYWIKSLYVSTALQSSGIGRAAMDLVEDMATKPPLSAKTLMLDTISKEDQLDPVSSKVANGKLPPMPTHAWYERRGYKHIWTEPNMYGFPETDEDGNKIVRRTVILRRDLF
ncbi:hypothetical protein CCHL11_04153 [Colletotrichum chlorophyti]|uniref:N-acetyltransferase domain-containing protein n=1 Tax=Colletotrichum chlorophyti TaxID=708187 RepID=A0A1Q8RPE9_9PEZI|nr:hypothetical protein CCHL11_04153 [Colletotrichum chlorophyti]